MVHTEINVDSSVAALMDADSVTIVPGYGLAVAGAAPSVAEIANKLRGMGKEVKFAVHPVAGRKTLDSNTNRHPPAATLSISRPTVNQRPSTQRC